MASLQTTSPLITTSGVLFTGVLRIFPSTYDPLFGPVKEIPIIDGVLTSPTPLPDGEYCLQVLYGESVGSGTTVACQMVGFHEGVQEVDAFIESSVSFNTHIRNLAQTRRELDECQTELEIVTEDLQSLEQIRQDLEACQELIIELESEIEILEQQLEEFMGSETEEAIRAKMNSLKACKAEAIAITKPKFELPREETMTMGDLVSSFSPRGSKVLCDDGSRALALKEKEGSLRKQIRGAHFGVSRKKTLHGLSPNEATANSSATVGKALQSRNRVARGMAAQPMEGRTVSQIKASGCSVPQSVKEKTDSIKEMMERIKGSC